MSVEAITEFLATAGGIGGLIALLVGIGKQVGWVKDGSSALVVRTINLIVLVALFVVGNSPDITLDFAGLDTLAGTISDAGFLLLGLLIPGANWASAKTYGLVKGTPLVGKSYSL